MEDLIDPEFETEFSHYEYDEYLAYIDYCEFDAMIEGLKQDIYEYNKYGAIWEEADRLAEEEEMREYQEKAAASMYYGGL